MIADNSITVIDLPINMPGNPNLGSCPLEKVCLTFSHTYIGDISISLQSPNGEHYLIMSDAGNNFGECGAGQDNAEICIERGTAHPLMNNTEYVCNSAFCSLGTCCLNGNWTVPCGGVTSPNTTATQAPHCDLNDFNVAGAPVNGVWKLVFLDICAVDFGTLHNAYLSFGCSGNSSGTACEANGGVLGMDNLVVCDNSPLDINPHFCANEPPVANYSYKYVVAENGIIRAFLPQIDLTNFPIGQFEIWGFSHSASDESLLDNYIGSPLQGTITLFDSNSEPFCGDFSLDGFRLTNLGPASVDIGPDLVLNCWETSQQLNAINSPTDSNFNYNWTLPTGQTVSTGQTSIQATTSGQYVYTLSESNSGCIISDTMLLTIPPPLISDIATQTATCNQADGTASAILQPNITDAEFAWSNGETAQTTTGLAQGWYSLTVSDQYCTYHQNVYVDEDRSCKVTIRGRIVNDDINEDCVEDPSPIGVAGIMLHLMPADIYTYSLADGSFEFVVDAGDYTIGYVDEDLYEVLCPTGGSIAVSLPTDGSVNDGNNFYVKRTPQSNLCINIYNGAARPGFIQSYYIEYCNIGTTATNATISMVHDPLLEQGPLGTLVPDSYDASTHTSIWTIENISAGACEHFHYYLSVPASIQLGTPLSGSIQIDPIDDDPFPQNNVRTWTQWVIGSYDPNEKSTQTGENQWGGLITESDSLLHYQIQFQNTGTDTAFTVVIRDTLDADLNVESIRPGMASHPYRLEFEGNNVLVFNFRDIMLPDSNRNEPASHGYATFSIKRKPNLAIGTEFHNSAAIFFDYNTPIITNTVSHKMGKYQVHTQQEATICQGYQLNGFMFETDTTITETFSFTAYDSIVTTQVIVLPTAGYAYTVPICQGSSYLFNGQNLSTNGQYQAVLTAANGCDSTVTLNLQVMPSITTNLQATICEGDFYSFAGQNLTNAGTYQSTYTAIGGCDSISFLTLVVLENTTSQVSAAICEGESYEFSGQTLTAAGIYQATLTATNGCDSTVTLILSYLEPTASQITATICSGESFPFNGQHPSAPGTYQANLTAANGCDSIVNLVLTVLPNLLTTISATICEGESYQFNGQSLAIAGTYQAVLTALNGCDSTILLTLDVLSNIESIIDVQICDGASYPFNGQILSETGVYNGTFPAANGCDSTVTLTLNVVPVIVQNLSEAICEGGSYLFGGQLLTQSGDYLLTVASMNGCDSTTLLQLEVLPNLFSYQPIELAVGSLWNGVPIYENTTIEEHYMAMNGCDSTVFIQIAVVTGTNDALGASFELLVFPNPFDASVTIEIKGIESNKPLTFQLLDVTGRVVQQETFRSPSLSLQRDNLPSGLYFIKIASEEGQPIAVGRMVAR